MRAHDDQVAASGLCRFDNRSGWVLIGNMQEFCGYPGLLRYNPSFMKHFARMFLAGFLPANKVWPSLADTASALPLR
jgi:hypothetical protein